VPVTIDRVQEAIANFEFSKRKWTCWQSSWASYIGINQAVTPISYWLLLPATPCF